MGTRSTGRNTEGPVQSFAQEILAFQKYRIQDAFRDRFLFHVKIWKRCNPMWSELHVQFLEPGNARTHTLEADVCCVC